MPEGYSIMLVNGGFRCTETPTLKEIQTVSLLQLDHVIMLEKYCIELSVVMVNSVIQ